MKQAEKKNKVNRKTGELFFKVDCGLLFQLGEQLVAKRSVALSELVKNAYDADATKVIITIENVKKKGGRIYIKDNGTGMTFKDIQRAWMNIATTEKIKKPYSILFKRPRTGAKGVGRFAARRLATTLRLFSVSKLKDNKKEYVEVIFNWKDFIHGKTVNDIPCEYIRRRSTKDEECGVTLELLDTNDIWTEEDVEELQKELTILYSPFPEQIEGELKDIPVNRDPGFSIEIKAPEFVEYSGKLGEHFLESSYAKLIGSVSKNGKVVYELTFRGEKEKEVFMPRERTFEKFGLSRFIIHYFVYRGDYFSGIKFSVGEARRKGREQGGIKIFLDKFRIPPYGDPGDDWLTLDEERAQRRGVPPDILLDYAKELDDPMLLLPGNNQIFGGVFLSRINNPQIEITLDRERLVENEAFRDLKDFVRLGIDWMAVLHARRVVDKAKRREEAAPFAKPTKLVSKAKESIENISDLIGKQESKQIIQVLELAEAEFESREEEHISELSMLRVLASTGTMIVVFDHQLVGILNGLKDSHENLKLFLKGLQNKEKKNFEQILNRLKGWIEDAEHQGQLLGLLLGQRSRLRRRRIALKPIVENTCSAFENYMDKMRIKFYNKITPFHRTPPMYECEITAILVNLMTNSLKALRQQPIKKIGVFSEKKSQTMKLLFCDTGIGVPKDKRDVYFKPFVGDSVPDPVLGHGTGLGLKVVKDLVDIYGGQVRFVDPFEKWKTCLEISIPEE